MPERARAAGGPPPARESILRIPLKDRAEVLQALAPKAGLPPDVLEKDVWVCWTLLAVFEMPNQLRIAFKGGTALSKAYDAISRFSEDVDLTIDYKELTNVDSLTEAMTKSAVTKLGLALEERVEEHITQSVSPYLQQRAKEELGVELKIDVVDREALAVHYPSAFTNSDGYLKSRVLLEFGGRNTTLPNETHEVVPYAAAHTDSLAFPVARATVLSPRRMFWEKATLIHSECNRKRENGAPGPDRLSRHWYDLAQLVDHKVGREALVDRDLLGEVVRLKAIFYRSGFANYEACLAGGFRLIPDAPFRDALARDYTAMRTAGMFFRDPPSFEQILERLSATERDLNKKST